MKVEGLISFYVMHVQIFILQNILGATKFLVKISINAGGKELIADGTGNNVFHRKSNNIFHDIVINMCSYSEN